MIVVLERASLCRFEELLMATIMKMPVEAVEGRLAIVVSSSKVSSNFLQTTSLIAASDDLLHHSSMVVGVSIQHISLLHRHRQRVVCVCGSGRKNEGKKR